jgi:hypothetical protein
VSKRWVFITIRLGFVIIYLNQSSERNMIDIPGCSGRTNFRKYSSNTFEYNVERSAANVSSANNNKLSLVGMHYST